MNLPRGNTEQRRDAILDAALAVFGQYGYRRASMDDIAHQAGIAKGTIYLSFASKDDVFRALSQRLVEQMLLGAQAARHQAGTTADKLTAMHIAWFGTYTETIHHAPHADELLDAKHRLSTGPVTATASRYKRLVSDLLAEATASGELDPRASGLTPDTAADLLIAAARGLESNQPSATAYKRSLETLTRIMIVGLSVKTTTAPT